MVSNQTQKKVLIQKEKMKNRRRTSLAAASGLGRITFVSKQRSVSPRHKTDSKKLPEFNEDSKNLPKQKRDLPKMSKLAS